MTMTKQQTDEILRIWGELEAADPDASTERLMAQTSEIATRRLGVEIDAGHISEALEHAE